MAKGRNPNNNLASPIPERLREARLARGISILALADSVDVSRQSISSYELGHGKPSGHVMANIIEELGFPHSFFTKEYSNSGTPCSTIYFRSLKTATQRPRDMLTVRAGWLQEIVEYLEQYLSFPEVNLPKIENEGLEDSWSFEDIERIAVETRKHWGLGMGPISDVTLLMEKNGVIIARAPINNEKADACSQWRGNRPYVFMSSDKNSAARSRFDAAHELAHLILHGGTIDEEQLRDDKILKQIEKEAHHFASAFLLPEETFRNEVMGTSLDHFIALKRRWKVSIAAMIYRCEDLDILSENQVLYLRKQMSRNKMRTREPLDDVLVPEETQLLNQAVTMLLENKKASAADISDRLQLPVDEIELLCNLQTGTLSILTDSDKPGVRLRTV